MVGDEGKVAPALDERDGLPHQGLVLLGPRVHPLLCDEALGVDNGESAFGEFGLGNIAPAFLGCEV